MNTLRQAFVVAVAFLPARVEYAINAGSFMVRSLSLGSPGFRVCQSDLAFDFPA